MTSPPAAGYSGKTLAAKLGLKAGQRLLAIAAPEHYAALLGPEAAAAVTQVETPGSGRGEAAIVHLFVRSRADLAAGGEAALARVAPGGMLWVSWPKKSSPLFRDLSEDGIRELLLPTGWVDVKVAAVDADWSGLKLLRRKSS
jgi:hypothetical protein